MSKSLSYYHVTSNDTFVFAKIDQVAIFQEFVIINLKKEEEKVKLNFSVPVSKILLTLSQKYGYGEDIYLRVKGGQKMCRGKFQGNFVDFCLVDVNLSLQEQNVQGKIKIKKKRNLLNSVGNQGFSQKNKTSFKKRREKIVEYDGGTTITV